MSKRRLKFSKLNMAKYISHLDLLRCFTRSIARSGLPVEYSQGFNPHQKITFSLPLPVGVTSVCETVDISFSDGVVDDNTIMTKLNENLPPDIRILGIGEIKASAANIVQAEYTIQLSSSEKLEKKLFDKFFGKDEIIVKKKTKKHEKAINILDYVRAWELLDSDENGFSMRLVLDAGGERNLKPDVWISAICDEYPSADRYSALINREKIFCRNDSGTIEIFK